jgi:NarL family two-component system response regulator LiaR
MSDRSFAYAGAPANPVRVVVVDDLELMRIGLRHALESEPDLTVVAAVAGGREALELCGRLRPELVLIDECMPAMDGIETTGAIKQRHPTIRVLVLSPQGGPRARAAALRAGADAWLPTSASRDELIAAVRHVQRGERPPGCSLEELAAHDGASAPADPPAEQLTPRELDVLRQLVQGKTNSAIARDLALKPGTVKAYVEQIIAKLHVSGRTHAAVRAVELGLVQRKAD